MSDLRMWRRDREVPLGGRYEDPRARLVPGIMHAQAEAQQLSCSNCSRVRQWTTWTIRCMGCGFEPWVSEGCEDCGKEKGAWDRYNKHIHHVHGDFMSGFEWLGEAVPTFGIKDDDTQRRMWRDWMNKKPQDDIRMLLLRPLSAEERNLIKSRFVESWKKGDIR